MVPGISLANKSQLLFGFSVVGILAAALSVPWLRTGTIVREYQIEVARQIADAWLVSQDRLGTLPSTPMLPGDRAWDLPGANAPDGGASTEASPGGDEAGASPTLQLTFVRAEEIDPSDPDRTFLAAAFERFRAEPDATEYAGTAELGGQTVYRYARAIRESQIRAVRDRSLSVFAGPVLDPGVADPLRAVLIVDRTTRFAEGQQLRIQIFIIAAGIVGSLLAILLFYLILTKLIFSPVRRLRETAEKVQAGDLTVRSQIRTGDEFEQLAEAFNTMLDRVGQSQTQLQSINESLDLKVDELAQANVGLYESNRLKSEFLANVSHELRTPLNSIIGFAELLRELATEEEGADPKRQRYLENILSSGRSLLEMINELLDMAKIEAGRVEIAIEPTSIADLVEGLLRIMRPQAESSGVELVARLAAQVPAVESDPGKLQQILYNFLSNAIKFTPRDGTVTISVDRVMGQDRAQRVRVAVADTGPGIPEDMQDVIFEKFRQVDASHTRAHTGTGLGLAICRELAELIGASVSFTSEPGRGATFFVDVPLTHELEEAQPLMG